MTGFERLKRFAIKTGDVLGIETWQCKLLHEFYDDTSSNLNCVGRPCAECVDRFLLGCINQIVVNGEMDFGVGQKGE